MLVRVKQFLSIYKNKTIANREVVMIKFNVESVKFRMNEINTQVHGKVAELIGQERYDNAMDKIEEVKDQVIDRSQQIKNEANDRIDELNASFDDLRERGLNKFEDVKSVLEARYVRAVSSVQDSLDNLKSKVIPNTESEDE